MRAVRSGRSLRAVATEFGVSVGAAAYWVERARGQRIDRVDFANRKPGRPWNRTASELERHILDQRAVLREHSVLGEYGPDAIGLALQTEDEIERVPSRSTIYRVLARHGALDAVHRQRRPAPPKGWYLPDLASGQAELDSFDFIEDLKIADGPLVSVLTGTSLHGALADAWVMPSPSARATLQAVLERWRRDGLPTYAQLWQCKVWQRHHCPDVASLASVSARYIAAHHGKTAARRESAPSRPMPPKAFKLDLKAALKGTIIFVRRSDEQGHVHLLGKAFSVDDHWLHRLVRCDVDFTHQRIRFYALRRREPEQQPLLREISYPRPAKPFQGTP